MRCLKKKFQLTYLIFQLKIATTDFPSTTIIKYGKIESIGILLIVIQILDLKNEIEKIDKRILLYQYIRLRHFAVGLYSCGYTRAV